MRFPALQRAALRWWLLTDARLRGPIRVDGQQMDPVMSAFIRLARRSRLAQGGLEALRARYHSAPALTGLWRDRRVRATALEVAGRPARRYDPPGPARAKLLYFHGGGFIMGDLDTHDGLCRRLALRAGVQVISVAYRLAPEHPFPAGHDDAAAAWRWARELPGTVLVGGDSAGANLAAGIGASGEPALQVLIYPATDLLHQDGLYRSIERFGEGFLLTKEGMSECARLLMPRGTDAADPRLSPIRADLSRASPAVVIAAGFDPLCDQAVAFAKALRKAGGSAHLLVETALAHGFADFAGVVPEAARAVDRIGDAISGELEGRGS